VFTHLSGIIHFIHKCTFRLVVSVICIKSYVLFSFIAAASKVLSFFNKDTRGEVQTVTFDNDEVKKIFYGSFHKVKD